MNEKYAVIIESSYIKTFGTEDEFKRWVQNEESGRYGKRKYKAIKYVEVPVTTKIEIGTGVKI